MIETDRIYHMDCLEGMSLMADGSVDAIITDLPYGVLNRKNKAAEWDRRIPFAPLWEQYRRITKPDSPIILFAQGMFRRTDPLATRLVEIQPRVDERPCKRALERQPYAAASA